MVGRAAPTAGSPKSRPGDFTQNAAQRWLLAGKGGLMRSQSSGELTEKSILGSGWPQVPQRVSAAAPEPRDPFPAPLQDLGSSGSWRPAQGLGSRPSWHREPARGGCLPRADVTDGELSCPPGCEPGPGMPGGVLSIPSLQLASPRGLRAPLEGESSACLPARAGREAELRLLPAQIWCIQKQLGREKSMGVWHWALLAHREALPRSDSAPQQPQPCRGDVTSGAT